MTCAGSVFTTTMPVNGVKAYTSAPFHASATGTYQWTVAYSGDVNNWWAGTTCSDPANHVSVNYVGGGDVTPRRPAGDLDRGRGQPEHRQAR